MNTTLKIKANSREEAIIKAVKDHNINRDDILEIKELSKASSFLGFFKKDGEYEIKLDKIIEKEEEQIVKNNEQEIKTEIKTKESNTNEFSEEDIDLESLVVETAKELLNKMGLVLDVEVLETRNHYVLINLSGEDNGIIIGKKGKTLNSFERLLNSLCKNVKVEVDVEGFKAKRAETLRDLARKMSEKAINTGKTVRLNPMPPRERKIIHEIVNKYSELDTYSEGRDPKRYIVIKKKRMG